MKCVRFDKEVGLGHGHGVVDKTSQKKNDLEKKKYTPLLFINRVVHSTNY